MSHGNRVLLQIRRWAYLVLPVGLLAAVWLLRPQPFPARPPAQAEAPQASPPTEGDARPRLAPRTATTEPVTPDAGSDEGPARRATSPDDAAMATLRAATADPAQAERLARSGLRDFPDSPLNAERHKLLIDSIAAQGRYGEARGEAETMVNRYVGSPWAREVERRSGAHPRVNRTYVNLPTP